MVSVTVLFLGEDAIVVSVLKLFFHFLKQIHPLKVRGNVYGIDLMGKKRLVEDFKVMRNKLIHKEIVLFLKDRPMEQPLDIIKANDRRWYYDHLK